MAYACSAGAGELENVFFKVYRGLPREGPGDNESTKKAYLMLRDLPENPPTLDVGCGPGMQTIMIAKLSNGTIDALDNHQPFLDELKQRAEKERVSKNIKLVKGGMSALNYESGNYDLIWGRRINLHNWV